MISTESKWVRTLSGTMEHLEVGQVEKQARWGGTYQAAKAACGLTLDVKWRMQNPTHKCPKCLMVEQEPSSSDSPECEQCGTPGANLTPDGYFCGGHCVGCLIESNPADPMCDCGYPAEGRP